MTNPVKFPITEKHAPRIIYMRDISTPIGEPKLVHSFAPSEYSVKYIQEHTVIQMMAEAMQLWAQHERRENAGTDYDEETRTVHDQISEMIGEVFVNFLEDE